jgi:hypothetical protein
MAQKACVRLSTRGRRKDRARLSIAGMVCALADALDVSLSELARAVEAGRER